MTQCWQKDRVLKCLIEFPCLVGRIDFADDDFDDLLATIASYQNQLTSRVNDLEFIMKLNKNFILFPFRAHKKIPTNEM